MKKYVAVLMCIAFLPLAHGQSGLKPGLWDVQVVKQVMDGKDMTAQMAAAQAQMREAMAKMTPQQRQQMEKAMGGHKLPDNMGQQLCVSVEMAAQNKPIGHDNPRCNPVKFEKNGNKTTYELNCTADGNTTVGKGESVVDGNTVTSRMDMTVTSARGKHTMQNETRMNYAGPDCKGLKPLDQLLKDMQASPKP